MAEIGPRMLGKKAAKLNKGVPSLSSFTAALPPSPPECMYSVGLKNLGIMMNDTTGDCTVVATAHTIQTWTSVTRPQEVVIPDVDVIQRYSDACGYKIGDPYTDNGGVLSDVLVYWYNHPFDGHKLSGFASIRPGNRADVRDAIWRFGACIIGVQLPIAVQKLNYWDIPLGTPTPLGGDWIKGSWGGHAVCVIDYNVDTLTAISWGKLLKVSWGFWEAYCDEAFAVLSEDWIEETGSSPPGFDLKALTDAMQALRGQK